MSQVTIEVLRNTEVYELLCILNFNDVRKRMSVSTAVLLYNSHAKRNIPVTFGFCVSLLEINTRSLVLAVRHSLAVWYIALYLLAIR